MGQVGQAQLGQASIAERLVVQPEPWILTALIRTACRSIAYAAHLGAIDEFREALDVWLGMGLPSPMVPIAEGVRARAAAARL
jgi:hypothetical protein